MRKRTAIWIGVGVLGVTGLTLLLVKLFSLRRKENLDKFLQNLDLYGRLLLSGKTKLTPELLSKFEYYAALYKVPVPVALAMAEVESGFDIRAYRSECRTENGKLICHTYDKLVKEYIYKDPQLRQFFEASPDKNDPTKWGSYGFYQILPQFSLSYGGNLALKPGEPNSVLFDIDRQLAIGTDRLSRLWHKYGNVADVRAKWARNMTLEQTINIIEQHGDRYADAKRVIVKSIPRMLAAIDKYEKKYGAVKHFPNKDLENKFKKLYEQLS
ncbi:MAG: hypothetical protein QXG40_06015 [Ignisphaera sp.]